MIVVRAPMRISFVGGGTDLPEFYRKTAGSVISAAIDKFVFVVINRTPMIDKVSARYSISESVDHASELQHTRIKAALLDLGIEKGVEIASFASAGEDRHRIIVNFFGGPDEGTPRVCGAEHRCA